MLRGTFLAFSYPATTRRHYVSQMLQHCLFKLRAVAVAEAQSYLFPSVASDCLSYKRQSRVNTGLE